VTPSDLSRQNLLAHSAAAPHILVVGDLMLDHYVRGKCRRISPEAPVPVVQVEGESQALGGAGNVVNNLVALGARASLASAIGDDASGGQIIELLRERGVSTSGVIREAARTTSQKTRIVASRHQLVRVDRESTHAIDAATEHALLESVRGGEPPAAILLSDYAKGVLTPTLCQALIAWARERSIPVLVDPKGADGSKYRGATLVTPNRKEAAELTGSDLSDNASLEAAGERLRRELDLTYAMITLSEEGLAVFDGRMSKFRAMAREVFDVSGAGDTVLAMLGLGLASGLSIHAAAELANRAAGIVVGKFGSATVSWDELAAAASSGGIQSPAEIEATARRLHSQGRKIVFTNGCFDILHRGHVEYLRASKACGDVLIVGLNSDPSVRRLKGPSRPVMPQEDRAAILADLAAVNYVVIFDEETPYELISRIRPDVLTKGGDYAGRPVVGSDLAGEVRLIPFFAGCSTTGTIARIQKAA
jgi:D-beta-D-heptose 7-phosphate kinase/D-beta-D-heptose 1-phosphate adenosyltransferase